MIKKGFLHIIFLFFILGAFSQNPRVSLSQNVILIGEKITLTYSLPIEENKLPKFIPSTNTLPARTKSKTGIVSKSISEDIEILTPFKDTLIDNAKIRLWIGVYEITAWDSGTYIITGPTINIGDSIVLFPQIELESRLVKSEKGKTLYDIKESFAQLPDEPFSFKTFTKNNWWWILPLILLLVGFAIYKWAKRIKKLTHFKELNLQELTLIAIDRLEKERLWEKGKLKEHYIELSFILRSYLSTLYGINLLEKTTKETNILLQQKGLKEITIQSIINILNESDMVKFAKSQPEEIAVLKISQLARQIVSETSLIQLSDAE
jgi:hypothetical protein